MQRSVADGIIRRKVRFGPDVSGQMFSIQNIAIEQLCAFHIGHRCDLCLRPEADIGDHLKFIVAPQPAIPARSVCVTPDSPERSATDHGAFRCTDVPR